MVSIVLCLSSIPLSNSSILVFPGAILCISSRDALERSHILIPPFESQ